MKHKYYFLLMLFVSALISCSKVPAKTGKVSALPADEVLKWNEVAYQAFGGTQYQHSLMASRINAMVHLAIHDALNGIEEKYERFAFAGKDAEADPLAAAALAAYGILVHEIPAAVPYLDSALAVSLEKVVTGPAKTKGIYLGQQAALAVLAKRNNDGAAGDPVAPIPPATQPGEYQVVPPFNFIFAPFWEHVRTFSLETKDQFRCAPHPEINSAVYTNDFNEVKEKGGKHGASRTPDETFYCQYWYEFSEAGWNRVARIAAASKELNLLEAARLFALVDMAIADAYIAGWDAKLHYNFWRPYTAIRFADQDGNDATSADPAWESAEVTPPIQDYPSTHSALGNAAARVLGRLLGDQTPFTMASPTASPAGATRSFTSFSQAADENAASRVMAGLHFRFSCDAGQELGNKIGDWTLEKHLRPLK